MYIQVPYQDQVLGSYAYITKEVCLDGWKKSIGQEVPWLGKIYKVTSVLLKETNDYIVIRMEYIRDENEIPLQNELRLAEEKV